MTMQIDEITTRDRIMDFMIDTDIASPSFEIGSVEVFDDEIWVEERCFTFDDDGEPMDATRRIEIPMDDFVSWFNKG